MRSRSLSLAIDRESISLRRDRGSFLRIRLGPRARSAGAPLAALHGSPPHVSVQSKIAHSLQQIRDGEAVP